ncbi:hypothetical protein Pan241w_59670 [Gimesia alba]|uniref:Uncharacterized protein n=1 Tax=Gimesia alba TaxID=2527973 RepID=A0A517RPN4_9PLAN|nr:hypothetical protein Pan241w_59670 [Gimesia alba]
MHYVYLTRHPELPAPVPLYRSQSVAFQRLYIIAF